MAKLAESYVEFVAKGLDKVEQQTTKAAQASENAHQATTALALKFEELYGKSFKKGVTAVETLFEKQRKLTNFFSKNKEIVQSIIDEKNSIKVGEAFNKLLELKIVNLQKTNAEFMELSLAETTFSEQLKVANKEQELQIQSMFLASKEAEKLVAANIKLQSEEAKLSLKEKEMAANLMQTDKAYMKQIVEIQKTSQQSKMLDLTTQKLIVDTLALDKATVQFSANESVLSKQIEQATKALSLNAQALILKSNEASKLIAKDQELVLAESVIAKENTKLQASMLNSSKSFLDNAAAIRKNMEEQKALEAESSLVVSKLLLEDKAFVSLIAKQMSTAKQTEQLNQKMELQARKANIASGEFLKLSKAQLELEKQIKKVELAEAKQLNIAKYGAILGTFKNIRNSLSSVEAIVVKTTTAMAKLAMTAGKAALSMAMSLTMSAGKALSNKFKKKEETVPVKVDVPDTKNGEKFLDRLREKLGKLQTAALVAGGAVAGYVTLFTNAAAANTVEGEKLAQAYEYASRIIGDMFAPYVRLTTDLINKFSAYWKSLSASLKSSIAFWSMVVAAVSAFAVALPTVISLVGALVGGIAALASPFLLAGAAITAFAGYLAGVTKSGISMEERLTRAIHAVMDVVDALRAAGEMLWASIGPIFGAIMDAATKAFTWVGKKLGFVKDEAEDAGNGMQTNFTKALIKIMEYFGKLREFIYGIIQKVQKLWASMTNAIAQNMAQLGEEVGLVPKGTAEEVARQNKQEMDQLAKDQKNALENMKKENQEILDRMAQRMKNNRKNAEDAAAPIIGMFDALKKGEGKGFQLKANVAFEGLQNTFDRLQQAFANQIGPNIEQAQLGEMKAINQNMQLAAGALVQIKDKIPAVR